MFLEFRNTDIGYSHALIKNIKANLKLGDVCLIIGNNGVGKTTLIKTILSQNKILNGEIFIQNQNNKNLSVKEIANQISVVFSKAEIPQNYSVLDLISLGKYLHLPYYFELSAQNLQEVELVINQLGLDQYKHMKLNQLSDGNLQKAFIGRALVQNTPCIILDEPTTHLDEENKIMILQLIRNLARTHHKAILFSSHDWRLAKEFSDQIWLVKNQKLYSGITEEVLLQHKELTEAQLFQFNPFFKAPIIQAPTMEAEMLYSFLQKNINKDLSSYLFIYQTGWILQKENTQENFKNFEDILAFLINN